MKFGMFINDVRHIIDVPSDSSLIDVLRQEVGIKSVHAGCRKGICGSCLVLLNDVLAPACIVPAFACHESRIETFEGLAARASFADIEKARQKTGFLPCAECAASKVLLLESLLRSDSGPNNERIVNSLPIRWCGCTTLDSFAETVHLAWAYRNKKARRA